MKHSRKRLLAFLLVLAMGIGTVPFAALSVGAETVNDIAVDDDGYISDLGWDPAYVASAYDAENAWQVVENWREAYRLSDIVNVPAANTTLVWTVPVVEGAALSEEQFFLTSWKEVEGEWVIDPAGTNLIAAGLTSTANQAYDETAQTVTYIYTTTRANEKLRFAAYCCDAEGEPVGAPEDCPKIAVRTAVFTADEEAEGTGVVDGIEWFSGYVNVSGVVQLGEGSLYSMPISIPTAGTTISFEAACASDRYAVSTWKAGVDGRLELIYGCAGGTADSAWLTVGEIAGEAGEDPTCTYTYSYTSTYDNEIIRISYASAEAEAPVVSYVENNAENHAPILAAAGYDATLGGRPYLSAVWNQGASMAVESGEILVGGYTYSMTEVIPVYGAGTTITFVDVVNDAEAGVDNFLSNNRYAIAKFAGTEATTQILAGVVAGDSADDRTEALEAGKRVYTYTTTDEVEYLRLSISNNGNRVNGGLVSPIIYMSAPGEGSYNSSMEGLKVYSVGNTGVAPQLYAGDGWLSLMTARYGQTYVDGVGDPADLADADIVIYGATANSQVEDIDLLLENCTDALLVFVALTGAEDFAEAVAAMASDRVLLIPAYATASIINNGSFIAEYTASGALNAAGHRLMLAWYEAMISEAYMIFHSAGAEGGTSVQFKSGDMTLGWYGTTTGARTVNVPATPGNIYADNVFAWIGTVTNDGSSETKLLRVGDQVSLAQGDDAVFEPLVLDMEQAASPVVRFNSGSEGIRFLTGVSQSDYLAIFELLDGATVTFGTLIVPYDYMDALNGELTHASLETAGKQNLDIACNVIVEGEDVTWYDYDADTETGYIAGSISNIMAQNNGRDFTARGYAKLTVGEEIYYVYAENGGKVGTSAYELASDALKNAYSETEDDEHTHYIEGKGWSAYAEEQLALLGGYVDNVLSLEVDISPEGYDTVTTDDADWSVFTLDSSDNGWADMLVALGDSNIASIAVVSMVDENGDIDAATAGGVLLNGLVCVPGDAESSVKFVKYEYSEGKYCFLFGFSEYADPFY